MNKAQVNRSLPDAAMDDIDHALGRPVDPLNNSHSNRDYYATSCPDKKRAFRASPNWCEGTSYGDMTRFHVSHVGRTALAAYIRKIGDPHKLYQVTWRPTPHEKSDMMIAAVSRSAARYEAYLDVSDCFCELTFGEFMRQTRVRLAP